MIGESYLGSNPSGLIKYLAGLGHANEHVDQKVICGSEFLMSITELKGELLTQENTQILINEFITDIKLYTGKSIKKQTYQLDRATGKKVLKDTPTIWHIPLSLPIEDGQLSDTKWEEIANEYIKQLDIKDSNAINSTRNWVLIKHGLSAGGLDHAHLVISLVDDYGKKARLTWGFNKDYKCLIGDKLKCQLTDRYIESKFDYLTRLQSHNYALKAGINPKRQLLESYARKYVSQEYNFAVFDELDQEKFEYKSQEEIDHLINKYAPKDLYILRKICLNVLTDSLSEDEYIHRLKKLGLDVNIRTNNKGDDIKKAVGYSVKFNGIKYNATQIDKSLTLRALRENCFIKDENEIDNKKQKINKFVDEKLHEPYEKWSYKVAEFTHRMAYKKERELKFFSELDYKKQREELKDFLTNTTNPHLTLYKKALIALSQSNTENEYVANLRKQNILVKPHFAKDSKEILGYKVALIPPIGYSLDHCIYLSGRKLDSDLSLKVLREKYFIKPKNEIDKDMIRKEWISAYKGEKTITSVIDTNPMDINKQLSETILKMSENNSYMKSSKWNYYAYKISGQFYALSKAFATYGDIYNLDTYKEQEQLNDIGDNLRNIMLKGNQTLRRIDRGNSYNIMNNNTKILLEKMKARNANYSEYTYVFNMQALSNACFLFSKSLKDLYHYKLLQTKIKKAINYANETGKNTFDTFNYSHIEKENKSNSVTLDEHLNQYDDAWEIIDNINENKPQNQSEVLQMASQEKNDQEKNDYNKLNKDFITQLVEEDMQEEFDYPKPPKDQNTTNKNRSL